MPDLYHSVKVQMVFASVGMTSEKAEKAVINDYEKLGDKSISAPEYIKQYYIRDKVIYDLLESNNIIIRVSNFIGREVDREFCVTLLKQFFTKNIQAYEKAYDTPIFADYEYFVMESLYEFIPSKGCTLITDDDRITALTHLDVDVTKYLAMHGIVYSKLLRKLVLTFTNEAPDDKRFIDWLKSNLILDDAISKVLSYPDPPGLLRKKFGLTGQEARDYVRRYLTDNSNVYGEMYQESLTDNELEHLIITSLRSYAYSERGNK